MPKRLHQRLRRRIMQELDRLNAVVTTKDAGCAPDRDHRSGLDHNRIGPDRGGREPAWTRSS